VKLQLPVTPPVKEAVLVTATVPAIERDAQKHSKISEKTNADVLISSPNIETINEVVPASLRASAWQDK
jgi:hypothetical protein